MDGIEGKISIDLFPDKPAAERVAVSSSRPVLASRVMQGKSPQQVLKVLPLMFNVCGVAQARTAVAAIQSALEMPPGTSVETARDLLLLVENAREHLFRILIDWPQLFDLPHDRGALPLLGRLLQEYKLALFEQGDAFSLDSRLQIDMPALQGLTDELESSLAASVFMQPCEQWLHITDIDGLYQWAQAIEGAAGGSLAQICDQGWSSQGLSESEPLPGLSSAELLTRLDSDDADSFIAQPLWRGQVYETTSLARQMQQPLVQALRGEFHNTLLTRWVARLVELARIPGQIRARLAMLEQGGNPTAANGASAGVAQTEAARGRLVHRVEIDNDTISRYQILAPTEWNFHPRGLVSQSLGNLSGNDPNQLERLARVMINAIDPCVGYDLRVH